MALITDGILSQKLPWALVLLGVFISITLELCGVPALPFAVGVYLPLSSSTPILLGGLIRYASDKFRQRAAGAEARADNESDMSSGVLMATGFIAGGSIGGVLIAFFSFGDAIPNYLGQWQYRQVTVAEGLPFFAELDKVAADELGIAVPGQQNAEAVKIPAAEKPADKENNADAERTAAENKLHAKAIHLLTYEIIELNRGQLAELAPVQAGTILTLPSDETYQVPKNETLGAVAKEVLKSQGKARLLLDLNENKIPPPSSLPAGTRLKLPQHTWPALAAFSVLALLLLTVGMGWLFAGSTGTEAPKRSAAATSPDPNAGRKPPGKPEDKK